jgi:cell division protein FtsN
MSADGVYGDDMEDLPDFDDPALSELLSGVRDAYRAQPPVPSRALAEYFEVAPTSHRSASMRRVFAQLVAATTVVVAATGGLAVAGALPAPVQDAVSSTADGVGIDVPQGDAATPPSDAADDTTTTVADETDDESADDESADDESADDESTDDESADDEGDEATHPDNHGAEVSAVARDKTLHGCEHGRAVSSVASGTVNTKPCPHIDDAATTPTTAAADAPALQPAPEPTTAADSGTTTRKQTKPSHGSSNDATRFPRDRR